MGLIQIKLFLYFRYEAILKTIPSGPLRQESRDLRDALHTRSWSMNNKYENLKKSYDEKVKPAEDKASNNFGEMARFLDKYVIQVEALLEIVYTCRTVSLEGYIRSLANQIKYSFAHALPNYSRMTDHDSCSCS